MVWDLRDWLPAHPTLTYRAREPQEVRRIIIHHSATPGRTTTEAIARYHVEGRDWPAIAYHLVVRPGGRIEYTGDLGMVRYHAAGHNDDSVGICLVGDFTRRRPSSRQLRAARRAVAEVQYQLGAFLPVLGHRDVVATACPGDTWEGWRRLVEVKPD